MEDMMGGQTFETIAGGKDPKEAFARAREQAAWDHGHSGYTGTIAEKDDFVLIDVPAGEDPITFAEKIVRDGDKRVDDKWGPAGCVKVEDGKWLFFGWASC
jgi:hypothetical protein